MLFFSQICLWPGLVNECDCYWCTVRMINLLHSCPKVCWIATEGWKTKQHFAIQFCACIKLHQTLSYGSRNLEKSSIRTSVKLPLFFQLETKPKHKVVEFSLKGEIYWNTWLHMVVWKKDIFMHVSICYTLLLIIFFTVCAWLESMN